MRNAIELNTFTCRDQAIAIEAHDILERWNIDEEYMTEDTLTQAIYEAAGQWGYEPEDVSELVAYLAQDFPCQIEEPLKLSRPTMGFFGSNLDD